MAPSNPSPLHFKVRNEATSTVLFSVLALLLRTRALIFVPIFLVVRFLYRRHSSPLRQYPGPFLASGSRVWKLYTVWTGQAPIRYVNLHKKYGPIVRIAPDQLAFASPSAVADVFRAGKGFHKTDYYWVFPPEDNPDIFTDVREDVHAQKKRFAATPYSQASIARMEKYFDDTERLLMSKIDSSANGRSICDLGWLLHYYAFDVLGEVLFSRKFGFLDAGVDVDGCIKFIDDVQWYDGIVGQLPWLDFLFRRNPLLKIIPGLQPPPSLVTRIALDEMRKREKLGKEIDRKDLLSQLITANEKASDKFDMGSVFAVAHGAIFAGTDSTTSTMQSFFHLVLNSPLAYKKIQAEIDGASAAGSLSEMITFQEGQKLVYLQAALKEAMRLKPGLGLNMERHVPPGGAQIDGVEYPGGMRIAVNAWAVHRDENTFGKDAEAFRPERWLEVDEAKAKAMERHMFQFGGGSHLCIGKNLAMFEMTKVLPLLLREYNFRLVHPGRPLKSHTTFFVIQEGLEVYVEKRR